MKISIQPKTLFIPGRGNVVADLLEVRIAHHDLGVGAVAFYDLQKRTVVPAKPEVSPIGFPGEENYVAGTPAVPEQIVDESLGMSGNVALTPEQFASWGTDDDWFTRCVAQNLGLFPTTNEA